MRTLVNREPWWAQPPKKGQNELECTWGWLETYSDGSFEFDVSTRPSDEEIKNRRGCRLFE